MSTPTGRPARPASVYDYAPKRVRDQWGRGEADDAANAEFANEPQIRGDDDPAQAEPGGEADERDSSLVPRGPHENLDDDAADAEDGLTQGWEREDTDREPDETRDSRTEDWLDELEYRAELRERRAKAAEIDREYEDQLERLAASLRTLRNEDEGESEPERPLVSDARRGRLPLPDAAERDTYIDGVRLPRFLQSSYVAPPAREGGIGWLGFVLIGAIACVVSVPLSYYFYAVGNPFASAPRASVTKSEVQYSIASVSDRLPKPEQPAPAASPVKAGPPPIAADPAVQAAPKPAAAMQPPASQAEPSQSPQSPRRVPLTHVVRWPDQAQDNAAPQPPRAAPAPTAAAPALAFAPAFTPAPPQPARTPAPPPPARTGPPADDADGVQLLLKQGQDFVAAGDFATARVVLRRAAEAGAAAAALALAQTYDPQVLAKMRTRGVTPDAAEARRWYETAQRLGSGEAAKQLERLARDE